MVDMAYGKKKAKEKKKKKAERGERGPMEAADVWRGLIAIALVAGGALSALAVFGFAGEFGFWLDGEMGSIFGLTRVIAPFLVIYIGVSLVVREKRLLNFKNVIFSGVAIVSLAGLFNLIWEPTELAWDALRQAGGAIGLLSSAWLVGKMGSAGAYVVDLALLTAALVWWFNYSIPGKVSAIGVRLGWWEKPTDETEGREDGDEAGWAIDEMDSGSANGKVLAHSKEKNSDDGETDDQAGSRAQTQGRLASWFAKKKGIEQVMMSGERREINLPLDLLETTNSEGKPGDVTRNQEIIVRTLEQFGIPVENGEIRVGPTVTQYSFRPAQGVKLARVLALQNDLALALAAHPIRIEAPIPGKALFGVEVPNLKIARVGLREVLESKEFKGRKNGFAVPLGKDIAGNVPMIYVERAPHMLVAGATGSGKSVCLNTLIISLLYQNGPDDLKLIMIDPKRVELGIYAGIPHLLVPPIVKADEAVNALKWAVREMERRLDFLSKFGARDIDAYNAKSAERMPRIVIIIDELADLMLQNKREVEGTIVRIAQMARAAGIHLVVATQRPSVDIITGTIKANIPTRLAFAVASQVDSKTILDTAGADKLLGRGDMLMSTPELSKPHRVQGAFVSDVEITKIVSFLKKESVPDYNYQIVEGQGSNSGGVIMGGENTDPLLDESIKLAIEAGRVSTSYLQRRMKVGYSRAARLIDLMEELGVVSGSDGAKPREILIDSWPPPEYGGREGGNGFAVANVDDDSRGFSDVLEEDGDLPETVGGDFEEIGENEDDKNNEEVKLVEK